MPPKIFEGIYPVFKPPGITSHALVQKMRRLSKIQKVGHAGTLDPLAEGVMILLVGRTFTRQAAHFINQEKEYLAQIHLGIETTTYDAEGAIVCVHPLVPSIEEIEKALSHFQGTFLQTPPMYSAKKVGGKKLYQLARQGVEIERQPAEVRATTHLVSYHYPELVLTIACSKGTYIRSLAYDLGRLLGCGAHLAKLIRSRCGTYRLEDCLRLDAVS